MYLNELEEKSTIYVICTDIEKTESLLGNLFLKKFTDKRIKKKILIKMITSKDSKKLLRKYKLIKVRYLPFEFMTPASFSSYSNVFNIVLYGDEPIVFHIENKEIANSFKKYFELLWKICEGQ
jgi:hypothetical protein